ncbi:carboxylating nicotinate-nucleotide diphosphorylase [Cytobacillus kochii]|uniref:carboxylating nicotinate-nucleotide diphosphorylase n=1 Tax=Cytobacillus kochii TaxID=859143 RepID=UPI001CD4639F|nr:carboxylating nicotinate-nucleotide diphosphorylase [Cytobacillus kochii]MCA1025325.1 carboxylating nicotinate-nucleotide diphosphorylase [Cytobacillus kochii]
MNTLKLRKQLEHYFIEDIGERDLTTELIFGEHERGAITFLAKDRGVFCGREVITVGFPMLSNECHFEFFKQEGEWFNQGEVLLKVYGPISALLKGERVILNLVQRMCAVATKTKKAVDLLNSTHTRIVDTRKTTPGLRMLEKYAVRTGGGYNHRYGLYDAVMIKDNHISFAGSISKAVESVKSKIGHMVKIEVEIESIAQLNEAIAAGVDVIMFDNCTPREIEDWITYVPKGVITEASGGIVLEELHKYGQTGVDYISIGALTHSVAALDISVRMSVIEKEKRNESI